MTAVPEPLPVDLAPPSATAARDASALPGAGRVYVAALVGLAVAAGSALYLGSGSTARPWIAFAALAAGAAAARAFPVGSARNVMYHTSAVFLVAGVFLLPPRLLLLIPLLQTLAVWLRDRYPWPVHGFAVANATLGVVAAWGAADLVRAHGGGPIGDEQLRFAAAGLVACVAFVATSHLLLAGLQRVGGRRATDESRLFSLEGVSVDLVLTLLGVSLAAFWRSNPWLVFAALAPLIVVHRSLSVPQLQAEARVDPKTGLYNARYFAGALASELARAARFERPMAVLMADLDLLRDLNNSFGHLAGDAVLRGIADVFRAELRNYDVAARFGGEEFSILLPETRTEQALEIADRIRRTVAEREFHVATATAPLRATLSIGVAAFPEDGTDPNELIHQADLAVYRAKLQGRNRVLAAGSEPLVLAGGVPSGRGAPKQAAASREEERIPAAAREPARTLGRVLLRPQREALLGTLGLYVAAVVALGIGGGVAGLVLGSSTDAVGVLVMALLVGGGQALSLDLAADAGSISVCAIGSLTAVALFGFRAALPIALAAALGEWGSRRTNVLHSLYTVATVSVGSLTAAAVFALLRPVVSGGTPASVLLGVVAGTAYFAVTTVLIAVAAALESDAAVRRIVADRCAWMLPHYFVYGFIAAIVGVAYQPLGLYALAVFTIPLLLMRKTQGTYLRHTQDASEKLSHAAETIRLQNVSLEQANQLLRERSTAAMESLAATVDARDKYTAGHGRRVRELALALGRELGLGREELELLDRAALFHDIGKLAVPDSILLKPGALDRDEWQVMRTHAEEGARIIERLGFLQDAVPAILHHHERWDGSGYPDGLSRDEIPLGARIIHVADALDSMLTTRIYRNARSLEEAMGEIRRSAGSQFCPRSVAALERLIPLDAPVGDARSAPALSS